MKLHHFAFSPNCQKVIALAHETSIALELVDLDLFKGESRVPAMLAKNPNGKVPVLEDGDFVLWESNAILGYLAAKADRTDLAPTTPRDRADVDRWLSWHTAHFGPAVGKVAFQRIAKKIGGLGPPDEAIVKAGTEEFAVAAKVLDTCLDGKDYLCGRLTIADFALAPFAAHTEAAGLDMEPYPNARRWLGRMLARDSIQKTLAAVRSQMR